MKSLIREQDNENLYQAASLLQRCDINPGDYVGQVDEIDINNSQLSTPKSPIRHYVHSLEAVRHPLSSIQDWIVHTKNAPGAFPSGPSFMFSELVEVPVRFHFAASDLWANVVFNEGFYVDLRHCRQSGQIGDPFPEMANVRIDEVDGEKETITVCMPGIGCDDRHYEIYIRSFQKRYIQTLRCAPFLLDYSAVLPNGDQIMVDPLNYVGKDK